MLYESDTTNRAECVMAHGCVFTPVGGAATPSPLTFSRRTGAWVNTYFMPYKIHV